MAAELLRVVAERDGNGDCVVTVDSAGNLPGRGAWLHLDQQCLDSAIRRRAFTRALRITGPPDTSAVVEFFVVELEDGKGRADPATEQVAKNMSTP
ncbi:YlxR family protein [Mycolicibacterium arabiense]|uniref:YlxR family protein n=1 Tax=Mycolicibacterium arabiense TaxID=1286181 RepID=UPI0023E2B246